MKNFLFLIITFAVFTARRQGSNIGWEAFNGRSRVHILSQSPFQGESDPLLQGTAEIVTDVHGRRGRTALPHDVNHSSCSTVRRARESSLGVKGAKMFNLLPSSIRNINSINVDIFKTALDEFLSKVPDQPTVAGLGRAAESNCLMHQVPLYLLNH